MGPAYSTAYRILKLDTGFLIPYIYSFIASFVVAPLLFWFVIFMPERLELILIETVIDFKRG